MTDSPSPSDIRQEDVREALTTIRRYCDENLGPSRSSLLSKIAKIADDALAALSAQTGEPVAWRVDGRQCGGPAVFFYYGGFKENTMLQGHIAQGDKVTPLYASPPPQPDTAPSPLSTEEVKARLKPIMQEIVDLIDSGAQNGESIKITNGHLCRWYDGLELLAALSQPPATEQIRREVIEALRPFAAAWHAYGDKPVDYVRLADNKGGAYLEACLLTFGDLRRAYDALAATEQVSREVPPK